MCSSYGIGRGAKDKTSIFQKHINHNPREVSAVKGDIEQRKNFTFVIQKLIERPFLYNNRKFDIRCWVLLNASDGRVFIFEEPYVRTSSKEYVPEFDPEAN